MKYISILRGINVGGQKKIKMAELVSLYENLGFSDVVTYIQSGNVIFSDKGTQQKQLKNKIEKAIEKQYGFFVAVEIRTTSNVSDIIENCPFGKVDPDLDGTKFLVTFLSQRPDKSKIDNLMGCLNAPEKMVVRNKEVYLYCPNGYGKSKLSNTFIEKKLGIVATTRNWKSINKLYELSKQ